MWIADINWSRVDITLCFLRVLPPAFTLFCSVYLCVWGRVCVCARNSEEKGKKKWKGKLGIICSFYSCLFKTFIYSLATSIQWQAHSLGGPCTLCYPKDLPEYSLTSHCYLSWKMYAPKLHIVK